MYDFAVAAACVLAEAGLLLENNNADISFGKLLGEFIGACQADDSGADYADIKTIPVAHYF